MLKSISFGRSPENDVCIKDSNVSRCHCKIVQNDNGSYTITELNSTNGTFVNGQRINGAVKLSFNDSVRIGKSTLSWNSFFVKILILGGYGMAKNMY